MEPTKVVWEDFTVYSSSNMHSQKAGIGMMINQVHNGNDTLAIVEQNDTYLQIPLSLIKKWRSEVQGKPGSVYKVKD